MKSCRKLAYSMRHERLYLADIIEAADGIAGFLRGCDREQFEASDLIRSAVLHKLTIIGEAASKCSQARVGHPDIPWKQIIGFRNILVHHYFGTDWDVVWEAATNHVPQLRAQIAAILAELPPL